MRRICITGGLGFIGSWLRRIIQDQSSADTRILIVDNLHPQIHGPFQKGVHLQKNEEFICGDIIDSHTWARILGWKPTEVVHLAAETGTGQSMQTPTLHIRSNIEGTARLVEAVQTMPDAERSKLKVVLSSSRAVYGEGLYQCLACNTEMVPGARTSSDLLEQVYQPRCSQCGSSNTKACPSHERQMVSPASIYGMSKVAQEHLVSMLDGRVKSVVKLRFQNVYGEGQSLKNPYTGILAIFSSLLRMGKPIRIFEDGEESRDFVHVSDVCHAITKALELEYSPATAVNVGAGIGLSVLTAAKKIADCVKVDQNLISVTGEARLGDIRHNIASLRIAEDVLGYKAKISFEAGLKQFYSWVIQFPPENSFSDFYTQSLRELQQSGQFVENENPRRR